MTSNSKIIQGFRSELAARAVYIISGSILTVILARMLGSDSYGLLSLALSVLSFAVLGSTLGFPQSAARYVTEYRQIDKSKIRFIIRTTFLYILGSSIFVCGVLFAFRPHIEQVFNADGLSSLLIVGVFYTLFHSLSKYPRRIFQAFSDIRLAATINMLIGLGNIIFVLTFISIGLGIFGALVGYTITFLIVSVFGLCKLYTKYYVEFPSNAVSDWNIAREIFNYNLSLSATSGARAIETKADILMIGFFLSSASVGLYTVSKQITTMLSAPAAALGFTLSPLYSEEKLSSSTEQAANLYREAFTRVILLYLPGITGLIIVAEPTIQYVFGAEYLPTVPVLQILAVVGLLEAVGSITANGLDYLGKAKRRAQLKLFTVFLNVGLNVVLITAYGITGAAAGTVVAYTIYMIGTTGIMELEIGFVNRELLDRLLKICAVTIFMDIIVFYSISVVSGLMSLFAVISIGILSWGIGSYSLGLITSDEMRLLLSRDTS